MAPDAITAGGDQPRRRRPLVLALQTSALVLVAGLLALLVWRVIDSQRGSGFVASIADGKRPAAPDFSLPVIWDEAGTEPPALRRALADGRLSLRELRGTPAVLNFWASWCKPCKDEASVLAKAAQANSGKVAFVGVDVQDFTSDARKFLDHQRIPYVSTRDRGGSVYSDYGLTGVPETFYIDARGRAVAHTPGPVSTDSLAAGLRDANAPR